MLEESQPSLVDLERRRTAALGWLRSHIEFFNVRDGLGNQSQIKPLTELTVMMVWLLAGGSDLLDDSVVQIQRWLVDVAGSRAVRDQPIRTNNQLVLRAGLCALVARAGHRDPAHEAAVQRAVDAGLLDQAERHPHHIMIERMLLDCGGFHHGLPGYGHLVAHSMAGRLPSALYQHVRSAYEFTHDVMFGTALGQIPLDGLSAAQRDGLGRLLGDLIIRYSRDGHWDLVGELVLCWDCLDFAHDDIYFGAWRSLARAQEPDGSIPGTRLAATVGEAQPESPQQRFAERYHTTLVLILGATAHLRRSNPTPQLLPPTAPSVAMDAFEADTAWLTGLVDRAGESNGVAVCVGVLVGLELVNAGRGRNVDLDKIAARLRDVITDIAQLVALPASLTISAYAACRRRGVDIPELTSFVDLLASVLSGAAPDYETDVSWCEKRVALAGLRPLPTLTLPSIDALWKRIGDSGPTDVGSLAELALACSGHGTRPLASVSAADGAGLRRLEAIAVDALWRSDLIEGCRLIRAANGLVPLDERRRRVVGDFLESQRLPDGGFGFIDYTAAHESGVAALDVDLDVRLPTSLAVWWALAEINSDFRLFQHGVAR